MADERRESRQSGMPGPPGRPGMGGGPPHMAGLMGPKVRAKDTKKTLRRLWTYLSRQKVQLLLVLIFVLTGSVLGLIGPLLIGRAIDVMGRGVGYVDFHRLAVLSVTMLAIYALSAVIAWYQNWFMVGVAQGMVSELRGDLFGTIQKLPLRFFDTRSHGDLMSRLANDVENINNTMTQATVQVFTSAITLVGSLIMMLYLNPVLTVLSLLTIPIGTVITGKIAVRTREFFISQQRELGALNGFIEETISGQKVVKAFSHEESAIRSFGDVNRRLRDVGTKAQIFSGIIPPIMNVVNNLSFAVVAGAGGWMAVKGMLTVGVIAAFLNYSRQFARPINDIANQFNMLQSALAGAERVFEIMDETPEFADQVPGPELRDIEGEVVFENVTFGYKEGSPVLKNVSLTARPGRTIALVGPTGAGKTTIVNLLMRFYDIDAGRILIDGHDIRTVEKDSLRSSLGMVLQDTYLFSDTVRENIRYGRLDATDADVEEAARLANADIFIGRLPDGYDTILTESGGNLSQGQRQLLTIARAILADPAILILDEATSSVDTRTEMHIQEAFLSLMRGRTSFVIAHRLSTIREADEILVINGGEIIERGTHEQLLQAGGFYFNLYNSQFKRQVA